MHLLFLAPHPLRLTSPSISTLSSRRPLTCCTSTPDSFSTLREDLLEYLSTVPPDTPNPLSPLSLSSADRLDLASRIDAHGGYLTVSKRLNLPISTSHFIPPPALPKPSSFSDTSLPLSIAIGSSLDSRLESINNPSPPNRTTPSLNRIPVVDDVLPPELLVSTTTEPPAPPENPPKPFKLSARARVGFLILCAVVATAFGNASEGVFQLQFLQVERLVAEALIVAHLVSPLAALRGERKGERIVRALMGGPLAVREIL